MIIKYLTEETEELQYKGLSAGRQFKYHRLVGEIDEQPSDCIMGVVMDDDREVGHVLKFHYDKDENLILDSIKKF